MLAEAWEKGLYHRNVRIMVEDTDGNILLQRRRPNMAIFPGRWDHSAAGHVDEGMTYLSAARQEVTEEIGIPNPSLTRVGDFLMEKEFEGRKLNNFNRLYKLRITDRSIITPEPDEVSEIRWVTPAELRDMLSSDPDSLTYGLAYVAQHYY